MEVPLVLLAAAVVLAGPLAFILVLVQQGRIARLERDLEGLRRQLLLRPEPPRATPVPAAVPVPTAPAASPPPAAATAPAPAAVPAAPPAPAPAPLRPAAPPPAPTDPTPNESALGGRWLAWAGGALLVIGLALLAKVAWDRGWLGDLIPPPLRVLLVAAAGLGLLALGWWRGRARPTPVAQSLAGAGLAGMYLATVAARTPALGLVPEPLLGAGGAFALLGVVSAVALAAAVVLRAQAVALLALAGGQLALLVAPDSGARHGLLVHQLLVELGVLGAAAWCGWRWVALPTAASVVAGSALWWALRGPGPAPDWSSLAWLAALAAPLLLLPGARAWHARQALPAWALGLAAGGTVWFLSQATVLLRESAPWPLALIALVAGAGGLLARRASLARTPADGPTQAVGLAVAVAALALAILAVVPADAQAAAWLAEAVALLVVPGWIGVAMPRSLRWSALALLALGSLRTLALVADGRPDGSWTCPSMLALLAAALAYAVLAWRCRLAAAADGFDRLLGAWALVLWPLALGAAGVVLAHGQPGLPAAGGWTIAAAGWLAATLGALALARPAAGAVGRLAALAPLIACVLCVLQAQLARDGGGLPLLNLPALIAAAALAALALCGRAASGTRALARVPQPTT